MKGVKGIEEVLYLGDKYNTREELEEEVDMWDSTQAGWYGWCPRNAQYSHRMGLRSRDEALTLLTGQAMHAGMDVLYTTDDEDMAVEAVVHTFGDREPAPPSSSYAHLHSGFVEGIFRNYLPWRTKHDIFKPLVVHLDELCLDNVVAAMWRMLPDETVILGESKIVMRFDVGGEELIYSGKPDLPIEMGGSVYILDHKTSCGGYLSDWYFEKHIVSNQLRGYCAMIQELLQKRVAGTYINGIFAGKTALQTKTAKGAPSKTIKFTRYGPLKFSQGHLEETLWNQYAWREMAFVYQRVAEDYPKMYKKFGYPQNTGKSCQGCSYQKLCIAPPAARANLIRQDFVQARRKFLDL